jgi:hypothetical protein
MQVFELCPARYVAEYLEKGERIANTAASNGTALHGALELFVKMCFLDKTHEPTQNLLKDLYTMQYVTVFNTADLETTEYHEGCEMLHNWFERTIGYLSTVRILSCEVKENFPIKTSIGPIPFNYIFDRSDEVEEGVYKVVDYKSQRFAIPADELKKKVQVRAYGLAMQILYPQAKEIWVELDFLRHTGPVGIRLKRDDNIAAWNWFKQRAQDIIDTDDPVEALNNECRFCVRKTVCSALKRHISVGGVLGASAETLVDIRAELEWQRSAISASIAEIDEVIMAEAKKTDVFRWESEWNELGIGTGRPTRTVDPHMAEKVLGDELFNKYGSHKITMDAIDKLLKGKELAPEKKQQLRNLIYKKSGNPKIYVKAKSDIGEET